MELRKLKLKEQYRSDEDDIVSDFLIPCLNIVSSMIEQSNM